MRTIIIGSGAAGTAIAIKALYSNVFSEVALAYREDTEGSTFTNQKWKHSGLFYYPYEQNAHGIWRAYQRMTFELGYRVGRKEAYFLASGKSTVRTRAATWKTWAIPFQELPIDTDANFVGVGSPEPSLVSGGFVTRDFAIDFPRMVMDLRDQIAALGGKVFSHTELVGLDVQENAVRGVCLRSNGRETTYDCDRCVLAMGAWFPKFVQPYLDRDRDLGVKLYRSAVLTYDTEMVERVTVWMDAPNITLVPFKGKTLVADGRYHVVESGDDLDVPSDDVDALQADLKRAFPSADWSSKFERAHGCIKTGRIAIQDDGREVHVVVARPRVIGWNTSSREPGHGIRGLVIAIPGKASLAFALADDVMNLLEGQ